jgi:outer membrane protein assembly factor BamD (BamD/ComL family)
MELAKEGDITWLNDRKAAIAIVVAQFQVMDRQDSLQRIAAMPPAQRDAYLKKLVRALRRLEGLRDEGEDESGVATNAQNKAITDMFGSQSGSSATDWYFNNPNLLAKGFTDFRTRWGTRPNVDNWAISSVMKTNMPVGRNNAGFGSDSAARKTGKTTIDFKSLLAGLPLTPEKMKKSNDSIENALFVLGRAYQEGIQDYHYAINTYDTLLTKFPATPHEEETLLNLFYCYTKLGDQADADQMLERLKQRFPKGAFTAKALNPDSVAEAENSLKVNATHQYEKIYDAFIEGRFDEAIAQKKIADSAYGDKYWTPQLLYIESVYFIRSNQDPQAKAVLQSIINKFPHTPMSDKAATMLDVLGRRRQIEAYLTRLQIKKAEDTVTVSSFPAAVTAQGNRPHGLVRNDSNMLKVDTTSDWAKARAREAALARDTAKGKPIADSGKARMTDSALVASKLKMINSAFSMNPDAAHSVVIVMTKVDPVYVSEARNAFNGYDQENLFNQQLTAENASLNDSVKMLVISGFPADKEAMTYMNNMKALAPRQIVPWLPADKYVFLIISGANLQLLLNNKDLNAYRKFLSTAYPGKF